MSNASVRTLLSAIGLFLAVMVSMSISTAGLASEAKTLRTEIGGHWSTGEYGRRTESAEPFLVPLGAMKKISGIWRLSAFEPVVGSIERTTWQVKGLPVLEMFELAEELISANATQRWECSQRSCGNASEWASRVYGERLLYGRDEFMRYVAYEMLDGTWVTLFSAARTADRQYLHLDVVTLTPTP